MPLFNPPAPNLALLTQPVPAAVAATMARGQANAVSGAPNSGTVYMTSLPLPGGVTTTKCTMQTNTTAKTGGSHGWYVLTDANMKVVAVTADQTDPATVWGTASTFYPLAWATPFSVPATALYYVGVMVAQSAGTNPTFTTGGNVAANVAPAVGISSAIVLCGSSSISQTTPPALGTTLTTLTGALNYNLYCYLE